MGTVRLEPAADPRPWWREGVQAAGPLAVLPAGGALGSAAAKVHSGMLGSCT